MAAATASESDPVLRVHGAEQERTSAREAQVEGKIKGARLECDAATSADVPSSSFDAAAYLSALPEAARIGRPLLCAARMPSTQTFLQDNRTHLPDGTVVLADQQTAGRGRGENVWVSPPGCLMFSVGFLARVPGALLPFVQYMLCLAITEALQDVCEAQCGRRNLPVHIKWPNDLYSRDLKIGGILCRSCMVGDAFHVTAGIGLNLDNSEPTTCVNDLLREAGCDAVGREALLAAVMTRLQSLLDEMVAARSFAPLQEAYTAAWLHSGQRLWLDGTSDEAEGEAEYVTISGLSAGGYLQGRGDSGTLYELHPDGNSVDMMAGLIKKKLRG